MFYKIPAGKFSAAAAAIFLAPDCNFIACGILVNNNNERVQRCVLHDVSKKAATNRINKLLPTITLPLPVPSRL